MTKTTLHCLHGHPLTHENVYTAPKTGERRCRECQRIQQRRAKHRAQSRITPTSEQQAHRDHNSRRAAELVMQPITTKPIAPHTTIRRSITPSEKRRACGDCHATLSRYTPWSERYCAPCSTRRGQVIT